MRYWPKYKTAKEILSLHGYTHYTRGYVRYLSKKNRFHALLELDGAINLHLDEPHPEDKTKHKSRKFARSVEKEIDRFKKTDVSSKWYVRWLDRLTYKRTGV